MKPIAIYLFLILTSLNIHVTKVYSQDANPNKYSTRLKYNNKEVNDSLLNGYISEFNTDSAKLTSAKTLNVFFYNKISSYLSQASDLSLSKAYAVLDNSDGRLFLGGSFRLNRDTLLKLDSDSEKALSFLLTAGVKANVKDNFSAIFDGKDLSHDIGLSIKPTFFGRGTIWFDSGTEKESQKYKLHIKRLEIGNEVLADMDDKLTRYKRLQEGIPDSSKNITTIIKKYSREAGKEFSKKEAEYLEATKKSYNLAHTYWFGLDLYIPVAESVYKSMTDFSSPAIDETQYYPFEAGLFVTNIWDRKKYGGKSPFAWLSKSLLHKGTTQLTFKASLIRNNSVKASLVKEKAIEQYLNRDPMATDTLLLARLNSEDVYIGDIKSFWTPSISARWVYMPWPFIGISAAIEQRFGEADALNWKLGIPVSLKDKEGKAKVNFELVWKEVATDHSVGLSIGLPIGPSIF